MPRSHAGPATATCHECGATIEAQLWMIVDAEERPDLVAKICAGTVHEVACPHCGELHALDAPLLVYQPGDEVPLVFSPAVHADSEETGQHARELVERLAEALGGGMPEAWIADGVPVIARRMLAAWLGDDAETIFTELARDSEQALERLVALQEAAEQAPARWSEVVAGWHEFLEQLDADSDPRVHARARGELANAYTRLHELTGDDAWMQRALELGASVLAVLQRGDYPREWATAQHNLGSLHAHQYERTGEDEHARCADQHYTAALAEFRRDLAPAEWAAVQHGRGHLYLSRYERLGEDTAAELAERCFIAALAEYPQDRAPAEWTMTQRNLGNLYLARYHCSDSETDADLAERHLRASLAVVARDDSPDDWALSQQNLGILALSRYERTGVDAHASAAERHLLAALDARPRDDAPVDWALAQHNLGCLHMRRYERSGARADASASEQHLLAALAEFRSDVFPARWAAVQYNLGNLYASRHEASGDQSEACRAVEHLEAALAEYRRDVAPLDWAMTRHNLGNVFLNRYDRSDDPAHADEAERHLYASLEVRARDRTPADWAMSQHSLGNLYLSRYEHSCAEADARQAEHHYGAAAEVYRRDISPAQWAMVQHSLGNLYARRFGRTGDEAHADEAERRFRDALAEYPADGAPAKWAMVQHGLGNLYLSRFERTGDDAHAHQAEHHYVVARTAYLQQIAPDDLAMTEHSLGNLYLSRYERRGEAAHADRAEQHYQAALRTYRREEGAAGRAITDQSLGGLYLNRYVRNGEAADGDQAEQHYQAALAVYRRDVAPADWATVQQSLGSLYLSRYKWTGAEAHADRADRYFQAALEVRRRRVAPADWALTLFNRGNLYFTRHERTGDEADARTARRCYSLILAASERHSLPALYTFHAASALMHLFFALERWHDAVIVYHRAARALDLLYQALSLRDSKESWLWEAQGLSARATYALARCDQLEAAVEAMEAGRARLLAEALEDDRQDLERLAELGHGERLVRYWTASDRIAALQAHVTGSTLRPAAGRTPRIDDAAFAQAMAAARDELQAAVAAIRQVPGYADFFVPPSFAKLAHALNASAAGAAGADALVYLATTTAGSLALVVRGAGGEARGVSVVWLDDLTEANLHDAVRSPPGAQQAGYLDAYDRWRSHPDDRSARADWLVALERTTRWLWDVLMGPVTTRLVGSSAHAAGTRVILIPSGLLGLLPLHAAWTDDGTTPNGRRHALDALVLSWAPNGAAWVAASAAAAGTRTLSVLAVDDPAGTLDFSRHEVDAVLAHFPGSQRQVLRGRAATRDAVLARLADFSVHHLSTHGWAGWADPLQGGLQMAHEESLTLEDLLQVRLVGSRLAVLSACETGIPGTRLPDEVIGLPAGFLQAGVAGVIASLWAVHDLGTAMLMDRFYRLWLADGLAPAAALREAQRWLRDTTNREKAAYFGAARPILSEACMPGHLAADGQEDPALFAPDARRFEHPFWWAAFSLTGV